MALTKSIKNRLQKIRLLCTDVDGVLTDAGMYYGEDGIEQKKFCTRDGMGLTLLRYAGLVTAIVTSEETEIVRLRAKKLKIHNLYQGVRNKLKTVEKIKTRYSLEWDEIAYIGDDVNDLEVMASAGFAATPADGSRWNKRLAHYVTERNGGEGCVREICDMILEAQHLDKDIFRLYKNQ
ncbi:MAG: KdsC family phosphatase [Bacteroidota bacterium]